MTEEFKTLIAAVKGKKDDSLSRKRVNVAKKHPDDISDLAFWLGYFDNLTTVEDYLTPDIDSQILQSLSFDEGPVIDSYESDSDYASRILEQFDHGILTVADARVQKALWNRRKGQVKAMKTSNTSIRL